MKNNMSIHIVRNFLIGLSLSTTTLIWAMDHPREAQIMEHLGKFYVPEAVAALSAAGRENYSNKEFSLNKSRSNLNFDQQIDAFKDILNKYTEGLITNAFTPEVRELFIEKHVGDFETKYKEMPTFTPEGISKGERERELSRIVGRLAGSVDNTFECYDIYPASPFHAYYVGELFSAAGGRSNRNGLDWIKETFGKNEAQIIADLRSSPAPFTSNIKDIRTAYDEIITKKHRSTSDANITMVTGFNVSYLPNVSLGTNCVLQLASQLNALESSSQNNLMDVSRYCDDMTQGPQASIEAAAAALHRRAAVEEGTLKDALADLVTGFDIFDVDHVQNLKLIGDVLESLTAKSWNSRELRLRSSGNEDEQRKAKAVEILNAAKEEIFSSKVESLDSFMNELAMKLSKKLDLKLLDSHNPRIQFHARKKFYVNGFLNLNDFTDAENPEFLKKFEHDVENNIGAFRILPQWVECEATGARQLQVIAAAPICTKRTPKFKLNLDLVVPQYEVAAKLAVLLSHMNDDRPIPLHLTLIGQGAFNNHEDIMFAALQEVREILRGHNNIHVYIHAFNITDQNTVKKALGEIATMDKFAFMNATLPGHEPLK